MLKFRISSLIFGLCITLSHQSGFSSPDYVVKYATGQYESNVLWYVGETRDVVYDISDLDGFDTYTVALWQQSVTGGGAVLGPVANSMALPDDQSSFTWTVKLYNFDIALSNVFFFWIFNGSSSNQGDMSVPNVSSAYFNITTDDPPNLSSSTITSTTGGIRLAFHRTHIRSVKAFLC
ncbi:hypothetical protein INS49_004692 [Diaporthe citri]|uniref:uncharacterized protein n=1 Tax=Diaporthe citri TaxID=83186 RepID=UPI001C7FB736|nr:uncharacterized protein INS49_004692 [Diaporthe citri]KAG6354674.1 hypothetical protein INS49_004692 [Diaporthe citri]